MGKVVTGLAKLLSEGHDFHAEKVGLLANQASVTSGYTHIADALLEAKVNLIRLFGPEHGFRGQAQDMDAVADCSDAVTGLPVVSLYGSSEKTLSPTKASLEDLDVLIVDLVDVGARYYTFAQTLGYCMQVAVETRTKVVVLDRPNPLGGEIVEGAPLSTACRSFCGYAPVPNRHGMTIGELALMMNSGFTVGEDSIPAIGCDLEVVEMKGWQRKMYHDDTKLPWVLPSPNMPTLDTALIYPGSCLFEATELSEGRGTTKPLELFGAPYVNGVELAEQTLKESFKLEGAVLRPHSFIPKFQKHVGEVCGGVQIHVLDRATFSPVRWGLALIAACSRLYRDDFSWRSAAFEFVDSTPAIDLLYGSSAFRNAIAEDQDLSEIDYQMQCFEKSFLGARARFLLY